jgi:hypothetical protein
VADKGPHIPNHARGDRHEIVLSRRPGRAVRLPSRACSRRRRTPRAKTQSAAKSADTGTAAGQATKPIAMSQQDRMRMCSKQATGKKGAERKTFMKSCLTTHKS